VPDTATAPGRWGQRPPSCPTSSWRTIRRLPQLPEDAEAADLFAAQEPLFAGTVESSVITSWIAPYWITSSARASTDGGIVRPRAFAVRMLMTSSNFAACSIGRSGT
jgi:hypothetical protein